jgi:cysteinyl-tRNA synthetase
MIFFDTVRRYFEYRGYEVRYVSNFTDVDDKIIKEAQKEGVDSSVISERYIGECKKDMAGMNVEPATVNPLATQEIDGMIDMITDLIEKGYAYEVDGTVYFRVRRFRNYGSLSGKNLDDLRSGFRDLKVTGEEQKEDPLDFVLWKPKKEGEPYWESPWSQGRPGWHIECSVMSRKYLGEQIDIHGGGEDLIFPHHENEIAQSEASSGKRFARYWMHNAFLMVDKVKMSKSLGNFFTVREVASEYDLEVLRFFMLSAQYRSPLNFSREQMEQAKSGLERIHTAAQRLKELTEKASQKAMTDEERAAGQAFLTSFEEAMDDDFNTAEASAAIFDLVKYSNSNADTMGREQAEYLFGILVKMTDILGIPAVKEQELLEEDIIKLIEERTEARKQKNWARADQIRNELSSKGILLEDTKDGVKWKRA